VVADTKGGARDEPNLDQWYVPVKQRATLFGNEAKEKLANAEGGFIVLRSTLAPGQMTKTLRTDVGQIDGRLALEPIETMNEVMADVEAPRRFNTDMIGGFSLGALLLAVIGIYAVVAFSVSMRTQEMAIRLALGAKRGNIARLVLLSGAKLGIAGCALGVVASIATARVVKAFLFGVSATDPLIYGMAVAMVLMFVLVASAVPAARAAAADPMETLRAS